MKKIAVIICIFSLSFAVEAKESKKAACENRINALISSVDFYTKTSESIKSADQKSLVPHIFDEYAKNKGRIAGEIQDAPRFEALLDEKLTEWKSDQNIMSMIGRLNFSTSEEEFENINIPESMPFIFFGSSNEFQEDSLMIQRYEEVITDEINESVDYTVSYDRFSNIDTERGGAFFMIFLIEFDEKHDCNCVYTNLQSEILEERGLFTCFYENRLKEDRYYEKRRKESKMEF